MSSPKTCRRPSTSTCRRRQGFDKKVQGFTFSATWGECRQACRRRQRWRRERNFFDKDGDGRRCRRQQALVDGLSTSTGTCRRRGAVLDVLSTSTSRRQVPGDAKVGELGLMCCILAQICRCIEIEQQCARKVENESCQKWSGEGQDKSATSLQTSFEASVPKSFDMWRASAMPKLTKLANVLHSGSNLWIHRD